jgi:hypothetical protein
MRFFDLLDLQNLVLAIFLGLVAVVLVYLGFQSYAFSRRAREAEKIEEEFPGGIQVQNHRIPPFLLFVVIGFLLWAVAYVVLYGLRGEPF